MARSLRVRSVLSSCALAASVVVAEGAAVAQAPAQTTPPPATQPGQPGQQDRQGQQGRPDGGRRGGNMFGRGMGRMGGMPGAGLQNQFRAAFEPDFVRRDIPLFKEQLALQDTQMAVLESLYRDYEDAFNPAREEMQEQMQDLGRQMMAPMMNADMQRRMGEAMQKARQDMEQLAIEKGEELTPEERQQFFRQQMERMGDEVQKDLKASGAFDEMRAGLKVIVGDFNKWRETKTRLRGAMVDGLQASLSDAQKQKWPAFERFLAREKTLPHGTLSGEQVNLFIVLDEAGLPKEAFTALEPTMDQYELELHEALRARNEFLANNEGKFLEAVAAGDADGAKRFVQRSMTMREKVREVNDRYREAIMAQLPEADAGRVRTAALSASYDRIYSPTRAQRAFEAIAEMADLEQSVRDSIAAIEQQYMVELNSMNERLVQATRKQEPVQQVEEIVRVVNVLGGDESFTSLMRRGGPAEEGELGELMAKRRDTDDAYMERIRALLTAEQFEELPRGGGGGGRGGRGGQAGGGDGPGGMFGGDGPIKLADLPEGPRERLKEFDANNDGTIDGTERERMVEQFRQRGFGGGPGGPGGPGAPGGV